MHHQYTMVAHQGHLPASHFHRACATTLQRRPLRSPHRRRQIKCVRAARAADERQATVDEVPLGCSRYTVQLRKPLGLVLEEDSYGSIFVAEVLAGGNAERGGTIGVGDQLVATSGVTYTTQKLYQETRVSMGEQKVRLNVRGEDFKTIMAAIGSHPAHIKVTLEFQRCDPSLK